MACFSPLIAYKGKTLNDNGKRPIVFNSNDGYADLKIELKCGQCIGCRIEKAKEWAIRCTHEASLHKENCFITLTYEDNTCPGDYGLNKRHFQLFMKRLRRYFPNDRIRFYQCGEYGDLSLRPHYHALLFNFDFPDKAKYNENKTGDIIYTSEILTKIWGKGFCTIGELNQKTAAYVTRYVIKKINGEQAKKHYERTDPDTGEITRVIPEYSTMSRKPGIASDWIDKYKTDVYPSDQVVIDNKIFRPPTYYDNKYDNIEKIKENRRTAVRKNAKNTTPERMKVREKVIQLKIRKQQRDL